MRRDKKSRNARRNNFNHGKQNERKREKRERERERERERGGRELKKLMYIIGEFPPDRFPVVSVDPLS